MRGGTSDIVESDEALAAVIAQRDRSAQAWRSAQEACAQLYQRHARQLLAFLAARVRRRDLEDLHQAVWQRVWQHLPDGFAGGSFRAWLYQIARNLVIDWGRKKQPQPLGEGDEPPGRGQKRPGDELDEKECRLILERCLQQLSREAALLVQGRLAGESYEDLCRRLGLKVERAHKLFFAAKAQLQACVKRATA
jgi:RNA polymerase sigma-70 factor (ECF subfamily)